MLADGAASLVESHRVRLQDGEPDLLVPGSSIAPLTSIIGSTINRLRPSPSRPPEPANRLLGRVVVDAEAPRYRRHADAPVQHASGFRSDPLVHRRRHDSTEFSLERTLSEGAKPLRTRPGKETHHPQRTIQPQDRPPNRTLQSQDVGLNVVPNSPWKKSVR